MIDSAPHPRPGESRDPLLSLWRVWRLGPGFRRGGRRGFASDIQQVDWLL